MKNENKNKNNDEKEKLEYIMNELNKEEIKPASSDFMISKKSFGSQKNK